MRRIELSDAAFLLNERRETPMHAGGINLFTLPEGVDEGPFLAELGNILSNAAEYRKPFGEYVVTKPTGLFWELDENIDVDYHVRHSALPKPGRYRELFALASRLHSVKLDRHRPLWEIHLIEGLQNRQFAVYNKMHHAAIDGIGAMHITQGMLSNTKNGRVTDSPLSLKAYEAYKAYKAAKHGHNLRKVPPKEAELRAVSEVIKQTYNSGSNLMGALRRFSGAFLAAVAIWRCLGTTCPKPRSTRPSVARAALSLSPGNSSGSKPYAKRWTELLTISCWPCAQVPYVVI